MRVAILGASNKPERYSYKALESLRRHGHEAIPVHPALETIEGVSVVKDLESISGVVDTLTLYVGPEISSKQKEKIIRLKPRRVIFNPGTENPELEQDLHAQGIITQQACTLVLLGTNQF